jgi:rhodanese-related sulfurtransferase
MAEPERISPEAAHKKLKAGAALLVCAYDDEDKFKMVHIEGALSFNEFKSKLSSLTKDQEIIFYCA